MRILLLVVCIVSGSLLLAQPKYRVISIPGEAYQKTLRSPWTGGMNSPQYSPINLNNDNIPDLFAFDRVGDKVLTYIGKAGVTDTAYKYAPQYESLFPKDLVAWALIRDYNNDGVPDIFTRVNLGTRVYKGRYDNGILKFDLVSPLLIYSDGTYDVNIFTSIDDIPALIDVNRDGDIDVLTFGVFGSAVEYYENQTIENAGNPNFVVDSFKYVDGSLCWGNFAENGLTNSIALNVSCKGGGGNTVLQEDGARHAGSCLYGFDAGNDHDIDLLIGDISFPNLVEVINCGDSSYANICTWDSLFPSCNKPVELPIFPAAYGADIDKDGLEDLLVAPNARAGSRDVKNTMYYRNTGTGCGYEYVTDSFLVADAFDFGTDSKPYFFDFNYDGLQDIVVGNFGYFRPFQTYKSALAFLENTGSASEPRFELVTDDYKNFSSFNLVAMHPGFGDLDGDNLPDMVLGELNGFLHFCKNTGLSQANFNSITTPQYFSIDVGQYSAPFIYDVNGDSLNDLVVGRKDGKISYYWNFGTATSPQFDKDSVNNLFGGIDVREAGYTEGYSAPFIRKDSLGSKVLYVGAMRGSVFKYLIDDTKLRSGSFALIDSDYLKQDAGMEATISIADITNDGKPEYLVGNSRGGLMLYSDTLLDTSVVISATNLTDENGLEVFPNPANEAVTLRIKNGSLEHATAAMYNLYGELVYVQSGISQPMFTLPLHTLANGLYVIRLSEGERMYHTKVMVRR